MNKYAVIEVGGKQYQVSVGEVLEIQKLAGASGTVTFDQVLLVVDGDKVEVGTPTVPGLTVTASYVEDKKGEKVQVFKYKSKSKYRKMRGARQTYSHLKIDAIGAPEKKIAAKLSSTKKSDSTKSRSAGKPAAKKTVAKKAK